MRISLDARGCELPAYELVPAIAGVAILGWLAGMMTLNRPLLRCPTCRQLRICTDCNQVDGGPVARSHQTP
jgi:hypothetical protein